MSKRIYPIFTARTLPNNYEPITCIGTDCAFWKSFENNQGKCGLSAYSDNFKNPATPNTEHYEPKT